MSIDITKSTNWVQKMQKRFQMLDQNNDGFVDEADVQTIAKAMANYKTGKGDVSKYVEILKDVSLLSGKPGKRYNEEEFIEATREFVKQSTAPSIIIRLANAVFGLLDRDANGYVSEEEYLTHCVTVKGSAELYGKAFHDADKNGDGRLSRDEFIKFFVDVFLTP